jgi:hypothetical protein
MPDSGYPADAKADTSCNPCGFVDAASEGGEDHVVIGVVPMHDGGDAEPPEDANDEGPMGFVDAAPFDGPVGFVDAGPVGVVANPDAGGD